MLRAFIKLVGLFLFLSGLLMQIANAQEHGPIVIEWAYDGIKSFNESVGIYVAPGLQYGEPYYIDSQCGGIINEATYCSRSRYIYIPIPAINRAYKDGKGDSALSYFVAHEYAHAMQPQPARDEIVADWKTAAEWEADCLAGFYLDIISNVTFDGRDVREMISITLNSGDHNPSSPHGTPQERVNALLLGRKASQKYGVDGRRACYRIGKYGRVIRR